MSLLPYLDTPRPNQHLVLLKSSTSQSSLPLLRYVIAHKVSQKEPVEKLLFCFLHPPSSLVKNAAESNVQIHDYLDRIPGYSEPWSDPWPEVVKAVENVPSTRPVEVIIDSVDTLLADNGSVSDTYKFLRSIMSLISARSKPSRLILHLCMPSNILPFLLSTAFSPTITQFIAHPPVLFTHLATEYMTPPPPLSSDAKFWAIFIPISERGQDTENLVFGQGGEGSGGQDEIVVEVLVRGGSDVSGRRKAAERFLEGWDIEKARPLDLNRMNSLALIWRRRTVVEEAAPDPTQDASFNLHLTPLQQESRARVPLPYAHEGISLVQTAPGAILYDPDSADDIDDDDPDEDLDI
ncbi:hypothetical protein J3R30DRAFT_3283657 [Lentinula aciculospora]|uniref:Elongator complex protein 5 n=1 Tax=Lentinula aciculospora TaxID=153920 RepID=A0A9W9APY8_9AGAR|nr:hypothetical protein J3R30DRAFT_3283657 [Lentinula aciculospora]